MREGWTDPDIHTTSVWKKKQKGEKESNTADDRGRGGWKVAGGKIWF